MAMTSMTSEMPTYPSGLGTRGSQFEDASRLDLRCPQFAGGELRRERGRNRREQLYSAATCVSPQLDVDQSEYYAGGRDLGIPFDDCGIAVAPAGDDACWASGAAECVAHVRQGFGYRRGNCQCNDRSIVQRRSGGPLDRRAVAFAGKLEHRVRASGRRARAPKRGPALARNDVVDGRAARGVQLSLDDKSEINHVRFIVSRRKRAILRVASTQRALVVSTGKNSARISVDGESGVRTAQLRRMTGERFMPVPGDVVSVRLLEDGQAVVDRIEPRTFTLERRSAGGRAKTMAANVDLLVVVAALANPPPRLVTLDQLLAFAEVEGVGAAIVLTKPDLAEPAVRRACDDLYRGIGYDTIVVNPKLGENVEGLRNLIRGHRALLAGNSGVGKSTIFRALGGETSVGEVSRYGLGRQTTTAGRLYRMGDGFLVDSPGINEFGLGTIDAVALTQAFREMREPALHCRFSDCTHLQEPNCAVQSAVAGGQISADRYASYRKILLEPT